MGIFKEKRKQSEKPTKSELQSILASYRRQTAEITDDMAVDMMDTEKKNDFLLLLKIADYAHMGKSRAILAAFKLGYLQGKTAHEPGIHGLGFQNMLSGVALKLEKASTVLRTTIDANALDRTEFSRDELVAIGSCAPNICKMIAIADDYVYHAKKELEGILE